MKGNLCEARGCLSKTAKSRGQATRKIAGFEVCRSCYQKFWVTARELGVSKEELFMQEGFWSVNQRKCSRPGCGVSLHATSTEESLSVGVLDLCASCYADVVAVVADKDCTPIEAFRKLQPKSWRPRPIKKVKCCLPWCDETVAKDKDSFIEVKLYACGKCRAWLKMKSYQRPGLTDKSWQELALAAIEHSIPWPGEPEKCHMPWCDRSEVVRRHGPNGEPLCNSDYFHLWNLSKKEGISLGDAIRRATIPRLFKHRGHWKKKKEAAHAPAS